MTPSERDQHLVKSIQTQIDAGFIEKDIRKNLLREGYTEDEIRNHLNPSSMINADDKKAIIKKSFVSYIVITIVGFVIFVILFIVFDASKTDPKTMKAIAGMSALSLIAIAVGIYKFMSVYFNLYEVSSTKRTLIWVGVIAIVIFLSKKVDELMTALKI